MKEINSYVHHERNREDAHKTTGLTELLADQFKAFEQRYQDEKSDHLKVGIMPIDLMIIETGESH